MLSSELGKINLGEWGLGEIGSVTIAVAIGLATLTFTGYAPTVSVSDNKTISPGVASITITGHAPDLASVTVQPGVGSLAITGYALSVSVTEHKTISPGVATLVITGYAPSPLLAAAGLILPPRNVAQPVTQTTLQPPLRTAMFDENEDITRPWATYFQSLQKLIDAMPKDLLLSYLSLAGRSSGESTESSELWAFANSSKTGKAQVHAALVSIYATTVGSDVRPWIPVHADGAGLRVLSVLRKAISADLVMRFHKGVTDTFDVTIPLATAVGTVLSTDISGHAFEEAEVIVSEVVASDGSSDANGVASFVIEWA